ncbi:MAG: hypothetical protein WC856_01230 [Methylococcaceae bacterium]|jgi:hypothetical protein
MEMMWRLSPRGSPDHYHHAASQIAGRDDPRFAVVFPIILKIKRRAGKHQSRIGKVDTTVVHGYLSLIGIEGDFYIDYCSYNILMQQAFTVTVLSGVLRYISLQGAHRVPFNGVSVN